MQKICRISMSLCKDIFCIYMCTSHLADEVLSVTGDVTVPVGVWKCL